MSNRHKNILVPSSLDDVCLSDAVQSRFLDLCHTYLRVKGVELIPPVSLDADMLRWRQMVVRHRSGDRRHTEAELKSLRTIAQWTVDVNAKLRNQVPKKIEWT